MNSNMHKTSFGALREIKARPLWQYDYGQKMQFVGIELPETYEVHFSNTPHGEATTFIGDASGVDIPDIYLTTGQPVYAWIFLHDGESDGATEYMVTIPVKQRAKPTDAAPTPVQQDVITVAIAKLNAAVQRSETARDAAEDSAEDSASSAAEAATNVILAESWAIGGTGQRTGEDTDNAKHWSELAQQGAEEAGYAFFDIDDQTGIMMVTVTDNLAEDVTFAINENTGELEVIFA